MAAPAADMPDTDISCTGARDVAPCDTLQAFAGAIVHDLNNVLTAVIGNLSLLREDETPQGLTFSAIVEEALAASRRGAYLVEAVEAFTGRLRLSAEVTDINRLIFATMSGLRWRLDRLELRTRLSQSPVNAHVDSAMLRRAVTGTAMCLAREVCLGAHTLTIEATPGHARSDAHHASIVLTCEGDRIDESALNLAHRHHRSQTLLRDDEWRLASVAGFLAQSGGWLTSTIPGPGQVRIALNLPTAASAAETRDIA